MACFDVTRVISGKRLKDGRRIDFLIDGDPDGEGIRRMTYTWDPDETGWPMAAKIQAIYEADPSIPVADYVFERPSERWLWSRLQEALRQLRVDEYAARKIVTGEELPAAVLAGREFALATYNNWKANPQSIPEDWEDAKYWGPPQ